jgi:hypothetical protein
MSETPMSEMESQLRLLMNIAAGEPPRRIRGQAVRRKAVRRRMAASTAAAAAAVVLAGGVAVAAIAQPGGPGQRPPGHHRPPVAQISAGVPRYYVVGRTTPRGNETEVRATATGAVRAQVHCPWPVPNVRPWPVAPASNQMFFLVCQRATRPVGYATFLESRIYQFRVTSAGRVTGYTLVRGGSLPRLRVGAIAATPDGSEIAAVVYPGSLANVSPKSPASILIINTRTGTHVIWHAAPPVPGKIVYYPQGISLTADGQELVFLTAPQCFGSHCTMPPGASQQIRVANPAVSGELNNSRVLFRLSSILQPSAASAVAAVISPGGSTLTLEVVGNLSGRPSPQSVSVVQVPIAGHRRLHFIYRLNAGNGGYGYSFFSADPAVRHFLIGVGLNEIIAGRIDDGRLIPLKPAGDQVAFEVW